MRRSRASGAAVLGHAGRRGQSPPSGLPRRRRCPMDPAAVLPIPRSLHVEALLLADDGLTILAASEAAEARCPLCGRPATRARSRYRRTLADLPWAGLAVRLRVEVRKFFC